MYRDKQFTTDEIEKLLRTNVIRRNETINTFLGMLNSIQTNTFLSVDGRWGSGKTVFIKQIELLNYMDLGNDNSLQFFHASDLSEATVEEFQARYIAYYFNAWQNDDHKDPIKSLLFNLIHDYQVKDGLKDMVKNASKQIAKDSLISSVKTLSRGFVDVESIKNINTVKKLVEDITTSSERKEAITNIIDVLVPDGQKLIFLIDELDRCAPTFAVGMLEAVKHYYDNDKVVFIFATNNTQLVHTIKKYYGNDFDGANYLNKFFDLVYDLPEVDREAYIYGYLKRKNDSYWYNILPPHIADVLDMSMREITRYYSSLDLISNYLTVESHFKRRVSDITRYLFVPLALALKITDAEKYKAFRSGKGEVILKDLCEKDSLFTRFARTYIDQPVEDQSKQQLDLILKTYRDLFRSVRDSDDYEFSEEQKHFQQVISLINSTGKIDT